MDFSQNGTSPLRKFSGLGVVVLIHIIGAYFLITGLASRMIDSIKQPVETKVIDEPVKPPPPPPDPTPPPPKVTAPPPPFIPPPEVPVNVPTQNTVTAATTVPPAKPETFAPPAPPKPAAPAGPPAGREQPGFMDLNACKPDYPRASLLAEESGTVKVSFEVGPDGQLVGSSVTQSSGFKNLDRATVNALSRCKFRPALNGEGQPVKASFQAVYVWKLPD